MKVDGGDFWLGTEGGLGNGEFRGGREICILKEKLIYIGERDKGS